MFKSLSISECGELFGWSPRAAMEILQQIDFEVFPDLAPGHYGRIEDWEEKWTRLPDAGRILATSDGKAVGYWSFAPLSPKQREKFEDGIFYDTDMQISDLPGLSSDSGNFIYISAVVIRESFRTSIALRHLYRSFFDQLTKLAERDIFIDMIYANAFSAEGERMCQHAGAKRLSLHSDQGVVYALSMFPFPGGLPFTRFGELRSSYLTEDRRRRGILGQ